MTLPAFRYTTRFTITAEADPQLPARVLGLIACLNQLPQSFHCLATGNGLCQISMQVAGGDQRFLRRIVTQINKIPSVIQAQGELQAQAIEQTAVEPLSMSAAA